MDIGSLLIVTEQITNILLLLQMVPSPPNKDFPKPHMGQTEPCDWLFAISDHRATAHHITGSAPVCLDWQGYSMRESSNLGKWYCETKTDFGKRTFCNKKCCNEVKMYCYKLWYCCNENSKVLATKANNTNKGVNRTTETKNRKVRSAPQTEVPIVCPASLLPTMFSTNWHHVSHKIPYLYWGMKTWMLRNDLFC